MEKKCLLIGGAGFIGSNLAIGLKKNGYKVDIYDCIDRKQLQKAESTIRFIQGDYFKDTIEAEQLRKYEFIILLVCSVNPKSSMDKISTCYCSDVVRLIDLLEQMRKCCVNKLVFISSGGTVYGNNNADNLTENMQNYPINHYGIMKLTQEKILMMYNNLYGMQNIVFRLANPYGFGQRVSSGVGVVTVFLDSILRGKTINVYGKGENIRDYIYIDDVVEMICRFLKRDNELPENPIYNIGTGQGTSIRQIIETIEEVTHTVAKVEYLEERDIDVKRNVLSIEKIQSIIGKYQCKSLYEGVCMYYTRYKKEQDDIE